MKISSPNESQPFDRVADECGYRTVDGLEEIVHMPTGRSNMSYHQPEITLNAKGCKHHFKIENIRKREFRCTKCRWGVTVRVDHIDEKDTEMFINLHQGRYKVYL